MDKPPALCYFNSMILTLSVESCVKGANMVSWLQVYSWSCFSIAVPFGTR